MLNILKYTRYPSIRFTIEEEGNKTLLFLDISKGRSIITSIY